MDRSIARVYGDAVAHGAVSDLIRRHSSNPVDVRTVALRGIRPEGPVLDLGCGFGFMAEGVARIVPPGTEIVGVDVNPANRGPFLDRVHCAGCRGRFVEAALTDRLAGPEAAFGSVVSSYSLYFFPEIVAEVARVLVPGGRFIVVTHREAGLARLVEVLGLPVEEAPEMAVLHACSAETGRRLLVPHFDGVEERPYPNSLVFHPGDADSLLAYVRFKLPLIARGFGLGSPVPGDVAARALAVMKRAGRVVIPKDDVVFVCTGPVPT